MEFLQVDLDKIVATQLSSSATTNKWQALHCLQAYESPVNRKPNKVLNCQECGSWDIPICQGFKHRCRVGAWHVAPTHITPKVHTRKTQACCPPDSFSRKTLFLFPLSSERKELPPTEVFSKFLDFLGKQNRSLLRTPVRSMRADKRT